jgi:hypothetical protein
VTLASGARTHALLPRLPPTVSFARLGGMLLIWAQALYVFTRGGRAHAVVAQSGDGHVRCIPAWLEGALAFPARATLGRLAAAWWAACLPPMAAPDWSWLPRRAQTTRTASASVSNLAGRAAGGYCHGDRSGWFGRSHTALERGTAHPGALTFLPGHSPGTFPGRCSSPFRRTCS